MSSRTIGPISAYGIAKANGYTGTEAEFANQIANAAQNAQTASNAAETATQAAQTATQKADSIPASFPELVSRVDDRTLYAPSSNHQDFEWLMGYGVNSTGRLGSNSKSVSTRNQQYALYLYRGSTFSANEGYVVSYAFWRVPPPSTSSSDNSNRIAFALSVSAGETITVPEDCYVLISCKYADDSAIPDGMTAVEFATAALTINLYNQSVKEKDTELQGEIDALSENIETVQDQIVLATPYTALLNRFLCPDFETVIEGRKYSKAGNSITMRWLSTNNSHTVCFFTGSAFYTQNADEVTDAVPPIETLATINKNLNKVKLAIYVASTYTGSTNSNLNIHYCKVENGTVTVIDVVRLTAVRMTQYALYNEIELTIPSDATHFALSYFTLGAGPSATVTLGLKPKDEDLQNQIDTLSAQMETAGKLESTGDDTDRTNEILAIMTRHGYCELGEGKFVISALGLGSGMELRGQGYATKLKLLDRGSTAIVVSSNTTIRDLTLIGSDSPISYTSESTIGTKYGIVINLFGYYNVNISNVRISGFDACGIQARGFGPSTTSPVKYVKCNVSNCFIDNCFDGILVSGLTQNACFTNCHCTNGVYGAYISTRCQFANCIFADNLNGVYAENKGPIFTGCLFNDQDTKNEFALVANNVNGYPLMLNGCRFYDCGKLQVKADSGTKYMSLFSGCSFAGMTLPITCNNVAGALFADCLFGADITASGNIEETTAGAVKLKNCYKMDTGALLER